MLPSAWSKMASFEAFVENAVKPGPDRVIPGCACVAMNKDGMYHLVTLILYRMSELMRYNIRCVLRENIWHSICRPELPIN